MKQRGDAESGVVSSLCGGRCERRIGKMPKKKKLEG